MIYAHSLHAASAEKMALDLMESDLERLSEIRSLATSTTFKRLFKIEFQGQNLERWVRERIQNVEYSSNLLNQDDKNSTKNAKSSKLQLTAINASTLEKPKYLILGSQYLSSKLTWIDRAAILIHEARHSDSVQLEHIKCSANHSKKSLREKAACDQTIQGSYGFELIFLNEIALNCDSCDEATQARARELYLQYQDRVLDFKLPLDN